MLNFLRFVPWHQMIIRRLLKRRPSNGIFISLALGNLSKVSDNLSKITVLMEYLEASVT